MGAKWLWGIILIALAALLLTLVGPWNAKQRSADMKSSIEQALTAENIKANVDMQGNIANLSGEMESQSVLDKALSIAKGTPCKTCNDGKAEIWHKVSHDMTVKPAPKVAAQAAPTKPKLKSLSPYIFQAVKGDDGAVTLSGYVPNARSRRAVLADAESKFSNVVNDKVTLASGAPNADWNTLVEAKLSDLAKLDSGTLLVEDNQVLLTGNTTDAAIRESVNASIVSVPSGYNSAANITVPELAAANVGAVNSEAICQSLFDEIKGDNKVNFASAKAELRGKPTYDLLNNLASAANQCSAYNIRIIGHTDSQGEEAYNQWLSESRANSVVAYLAKQGVATGRMTAQGAGEVSPVASNATREGRAQNRRIEFNITQQSE